MPTKEKKIWLTFDDGHRYAEKIVYISCNSATQARDIAILKELYDIEFVQPVDMFPMTHHVENIVSLFLKKKTVWMIFGKNYKSFII